MGSSGFPVGALGHSWVFSHERERLVLSPIPTATLLGLFPAMEQALSCAQLHDASHWCFRDLDSLDRVAFELTVLPTCLPVWNNCFCQILQSWKHGFSWRTLQFIKQMPASSPSPSTSPHPPRVGVKCGGLSPITHPWPPLSFKPFWWLDILSVCVNLK